eukprot:scaffold169808_cov35-Tisochrysis_lutea.AAC.1
MTAEDHIEHFDLDGPETTWQASKACLAQTSGRHAPKDVLFKSPPRRLFATASEARSSRLRARAACVPLSDLHGVGLPNALAQFLNDQQPATNPFQLFAPSHAETDFRPIPRLARLASGQGGIANEAGSACDNFSSVETMSIRSFHSSGTICADGARAIEMPPATKTSFDLMGKDGKCRATKRARVFRKPERVRTQSAQGTSGRCTLIKDDSDLGSSGGLSLDEA